MNEDSFYSINRLVEFGIGLSVAQQMVKTMNDAINNMRIPGTMNPMQAIPQVTYYAIIDNQQMGPFSEQDLSRLITDRKITKETYIWKPGMPKWEIAEKLPEVLKWVALSPPPFQPNK
ncbi:MAG: GYF domain-containing protein [Puniceicoccales bacterium]|jgi:hypothetical protein|nr:GYF domain-containing protein [Puniceicoccales bacterium]